MPTSRRPYRSHKTPACDRCRRFKRRCTGGGPGDPCVLCKLQDTPCLPPDKARATALSHHISKHETFKRGKASAQQGDFTEPAQGRLAPPCSTNHNFGDPEPDIRNAMDIGDARDESSIVISPVLTEDIRTLERYFSVGVTRSDHPRAADDSEKSLVYMKVPRRREGLTIAKHPGKFQKEVLWQIMRPYARELIRLCVI